MRKKSIRENDWWTGDMLILITESRVRFSHWTSSFLFVMFKFDDDRTWSIDRWCSSLGEQGGKWCCWWTWWIFWVDPDFFQVICGLFSLKLPLNESEPVVESREFMITWNEYVAFLCAAWRCLEMWVNQVRIFILKNGASFPRCCCIVLVDWCRLSWMFCSSWVIDVKWNSEWRKQKVLSEETGLFGL